MSRYLQMLGHNVPSGSKLTLLEFEVAPKNAAFLLNKLTNETRVSHRSYTNMNVLVCIFSMSSQSLEILFDFIASLS